MVSITTVVIHVCFVFLKKKYFEFFCKNYLAKILEKQKYIHIRFCDVFYFLYFLNIILTLYYQFKFKFMKPKCYPGCVCNMYQNKERYI